MKNVDAFVDLCKCVIADCTAGLLDFRLAAEKIYKQAHEHPFENDAHPMIDKVADLAFDITEEYRSDSADMADWESIVKTIKNYVDGDWESTCWILSAMYGKYSGGKLAHSYSVAVLRQNGKVIVVTASDNLKTEFNIVIKKVNSEQTDERYLQNLAKLAPPTIGEYELTNLEVAEYLTEPYYSTAFPSK